MTGQKRVLQVLAYVGGFICAFVGVELLVGFFVGPLLLGPIADSEFFAGGSLLFSLFAAGGVVWWGARSLQGSRPSPDAFRSTAPSRHQVIATLGTPQAAPMRNSQVIATFRRTTGRSAQRIFRRGDSFMIESHGPFSAADVMRYDEQGQLRWVNDGIRASVGSIACRPQGLASSSHSVRKPGMAGPAQGSSRASSAADTAPRERTKPPEAHAPKATSAGEAKTPRAAVVSGSAASRPGTASGLSKGTNALAAPLEAAQPARGPVVIATFGPMTHWSGRAVTYEGGQIFIEGHGQVTANAIMYYDRCGNLTWAHAGLRKRVEAMATPAGPASTPTPAVVASAQDPLLKESPAETTQPETSLAPPDGGDEDSEPARMDPISIIPPALFQESPAETTPQKATLAPANESDEGSDRVRMDPISLIRSLGQLRDEGFLSDEAFEAKKAEILGRL